MTLTRLEIPNTLTLFSGALLNFMIIYLYLVIWRDTSEALSRGRLFGFNFHG